MAYTVTYLGSQVETTSDNTITLSNCTTDDDDALVVFAGGWDTTGTPTVDYGGVDIINDDWRLAPVSKLSGGIWRKNAVWNGRTNDITVTFGSSLVTAGSFVVGKTYKIVTVGTTDYTLIGAANNNVGTIFTATGVGSGTGTARTQATRRWVVAYAITNAGRNDQIKRNVQDTATTAPNTLLSAALATNNELMLAYHLSNGPVTDTAGTPESGLTTLHRFGTTTGTNDITIQTTTKEVVATDAIRSYMTGATSRQWLSALIALRPLVVAPPALDTNGVEIVVGDSVNYPGGSSTVSSIASNPGSIQSKVTLASGHVYKSYDLEVTS